MQWPLLAPRVRGRGIATVACLLGILLVGCGANTQQSARAQIRKVVRAYLRAQAAGDGPTACALLAPTGRAELVALVITAARGVIAVKPSCPRAIRLLRGIVGTQVLNSLVHVHIRHIRVSGLRARARILDPGRRFPPQLVGLQKETEGWRIAAVRG